MKIDAAISVPEIMEWLVRASPESLVTLVTSGTTGEPKEITRPLGVVRGRPQPGAAWAVCYRPHRWAGLSILWRCARLGETPISPPAWTPEGIAAAIQDATHAALTPSLFRTLVVRGLLRGPRARRLEVITFGGEAAQQRDIDQARALFPGARVVHVYATTEHGDVMAEADGRAGYSAATVGRNRRVRFAGRELVVDGRPTGDIFEAGGGRVYFIGRRDALISVGGEKVHPEAVEAAAARCGARLSRAYAVPSALLGSVVGLDYIGDISEREMAAALAGELDKAWCPVVLWRVGEIPLTDAGKVVRA